MRVCGNCCKYWQGARSGDPPEATEPHPVVARLRPVQQGCDTRHDVREGPELGRLAPCPPQGEATPAQICRALLFPRLEVRRELHGLPGGSRNGGSRPRQGVCW
ncbi:unnamed protein product [Ectocarpus fasciculatus]